MANRIGLGLALTDGSGAPLGASYEALPVTANLVSDWDASYEITLNGSDVSQWTPSAGDANLLVQATAADQPLYNSTDADFNGHASIQFDGVTENLATIALLSGNMTQPTTVFVVMKMIVAGITKTVFDGIDGTDRQASIISGFGAFNPFAGASMTGTLAADTNVNILCIRYNGASSDSYINGGTADGSGNIGANDLGGLTLGTRYDGTNPADMKAARVALYDGLLSDANANLVGNALATRYGTTWTDI